MHKFPNDFYGEKLKVVLLGEIRKMTTFKNAGTIYILIFIICESKNTRNYGFQTDIIS